MNRKWITALVAVLLIAMLAACGEAPQEEAAAPEAPAATVLKIGSMSPLTGPYAADGNDIANGARAAIQVITEQGGIPGFSSIELMAEDTACDPRQAVAAANKLIAEEVVGVVGAYCSSSTIPASETLAEVNIPMLTPASTNPQVTERGLPYMFRICGRDDDQAPAAVNFMVNGLHAQTIFIVDDKTTYSQGLAEEVAANAEAAGMTVLAHEHVNQGDRDFSAVLTNVAAANPDVFYISLQNSATGALMLIQAKRMGINAALMGQDAVYHPQLIETGGEAAEGAYLTFGYTDQTTDAYQTFLNAYAQYGDPGAYSAYAYDAALALLTAIKEAGSTDPAAIRAQLMSMSLPGASKVIAFEENGDSGSNYIVFKVVNGAFVPYYNPATGEMF